METGLEGKPWYVGLIVGLVIGAILLAVGYQFKLKDMRAQIVGQENTLKDLRKQIERGLAAKAQLPAFQERVAKAQQDLDKLLDILPDRRNVHELVRQVRLLAEREDFNLTRFTTGRQTQREYFNEWPITISLQGTYHNLARFFDRMSRFSRIINVDDLRIGTVRNQRPNRTIGASFVAKTFIYREEVPPAPAPSAGGGS
jgi:Tfp pilus assembly protein PilO